jgi:hypothetical protein
MIDDDEAMRRAVKAFYDGAGFESLEKASGKPSKYKKEYFDNFETDIRKGIGAKNAAKEKEKK